MRIRLPLIALLAFSACDTPIGTEIARDQAKGVVSRVVEDRAPSVDPRPVTDCIIDNATGSEIVQIAADSITGTVSDETVRLVLEIAGRRDTITCFIEEAGPLVAAQFALAL